MIGTVKVYLGQQYVAIAMQPYLRKDGAIAEIVTWQSRCPVCGQTFTFELSARTSKFQPNRRCQKHKRPGCRVKATRKAQISQK